MLKINHLDAHDRLKYFTKQSFSIGECCQDLINQRPFGNYPFYIFAHPRTDENGTTKRLIWQPRLTKPKSQTNSMLFKAYPMSDIIKIIWIIPPRELWEQYKKGKLTENETISNSITNFQKNRTLLEAKEEDDLDEETINSIYSNIAIELKRKKQMDRLWFPK